jgi:hypothetical protein
MSRTFWGGWGFALSVAALAGPAARVVHADAVAPAPEQCPKGTVPWSDHGGPSCELAPPEDCGPGYVGVIGGTCTLRLCNGDAQCADTPCRKVNACQEYRKLHWTGWHWAQGEPSSGSNFLAGPPQPAPEEPAPYAWVPLGICGQDGPCAKPAECRPLHLCYPDGVEPATARSSARPKPPMQPGSSRERPGGCAKSCAVARTPFVGSALFFASVAVLGLVRRRRP